MTSDCPVAKEEFDVIIVGTGLTESILSASLSTAGARVLHLDANDFYGSTDATIALSKVEAAAKAGLNGEDGTLAGIIDDVAIACSPDLDADRLRRVSIDLSPRPVLAAGPLVSILIETGARHYMTFRPFEASYLWFPSESDGLTTNVEEGSCIGRLEKVPASRADVFQNKFLSMLEKRLLMRFLKNAASETEASTSTTGNEPDEDTQRDGDSVASAKEDLDGISFEDFMVRERLTSKLQMFLTHCIAFSDELANRLGGRVSGTAGRSAVEDYMKSLVRYGTPTPFLYPQYGFGELCQAFCRISAVHGGTFILRNGAKRLSGRCEEPENLSDAGNAKSPSTQRQCYGIETMNGDTFRAPHLFVSGSSMIGCEGLIPQRQSTKSWRYICVLEKSAFKDSSRALAVFPKKSLGISWASVRISQIDSTSDMCPEGLFILFAETYAGGSLDDVLKAVNQMVISCRNWESGETAASGPVVDSDGRDPRPEALWDMSFSRTTFESGEATVKDGNTGPVLVDASVEVDAPSCIAEARRCFEILFPAEKFFVKEEPPLPPMEEAVSDSLP